LLICAALNTRAIAQPTALQQPAPAATPATPAPVAPTPAAPAPAPAAEPTAEQREAARVAYDRGRKLFAENKFADARAAFQEAYDNVPNPIVLVSIGECQLRLGNFEDSHDAFTRYLEGRPDAPDRADVEKKLADIVAMPATLVITTAPAGASVKVDGQDSGKVTPAEIHVPRGLHTLELTLAGYTAITEPLSAKAGVRHELHAELQPVPPPPPPVVAPPPPPPPAPPEPPTEAIWITGVVGATGIIAGTVLGFMALSERSDYDANPTSGSADRGERLALFADVAFGVGAMGALTALVLYVTSDDAPEASPGEGEPAASVTPVIGPTQIGVVAGGRF
jgi:Ni,Fe-hydrogenase III small subunit